MALDGAFLYAVKKEMDCLIGARVEKVYQPSRDEIILSLRTRERGYKLLISASADRARVHLTDIQAENPKVPPMFCMLMRKRLGSGRLLSIRQDGLERALYLEFSCINELGDVVNLTLACEIMGRYSNLILIDENNRIIDSIKRVDAEMSSKRLVLPGMPYELPPRDERLNFLECTDSEIRNAVSSEIGSLPKVLLRVLEGVSPVLVREWAFYAGRGAEIRCENIDEDTMDRLCFAISRTKAMLTEENCHFTIAAQKDGQLKDFSFIPLHQYGTLMVTREMPSACALLDTFYAQRDRAARMKQRANDLFRLLLQRSERISRRISSQTEELMQCGEKDILRRKADLISANLYRIKKGDKSVILEDFYEPECPEVSIELDIMLTPPQNAQRYYSAYKKACTAEKVLAEQIESGRDELAYLDSVLDILTRAETENDLEQLRLELAEQGYIRSSRLKGKAPKSLPPIEYVSSDGFEIFVGRNNKQNDKLTLKDAEKLDIWLHTQNIPGSHVIISSLGGEVPMNTILEAAQLAAYHSKAQTSAQVPVDYCLVKFVKKPAGAKPGKVIFSNQHTVYVTPPADINAFKREKR